MVELLKIHKRGGNMFCPKCGVETKEGDRFCSSCGATIEPITEIEVGKRFCSKCGAELREGDNVCSSCGTRIGELGIEKAAEEKYPHLLATILGYIFGFLGGWIGIAFGIYLLTREHPRAKFHGKIVLALTLFMIVFWILVIILGS